MSDLPPNIRWRILFSYISVIVLSWMLWFFVRGVQQKLREIDARLEKLEQKKG